MFNNPLDKTLDLDFGEHEIEKESGMKELEDLQRFHGM